MPACSVSRSCPTLCGPMDCRLPGSSVHEIFQAKILKWIAISYFRRPSWPRDQTHVSLVSPALHSHCNTWETPQYNVERNNIEVYTKHTGVLTNEAINSAGNERLRGESRKSREEIAMEAFKEWPNGQGAVAFQAEETNSTVTQSEGHMYWKKSKWSGEAWPQVSRGSVWVHNKERSWRHKEKAFLWTSKKFRL